MINRYGVDNMKTKPEKKPPVLSPMYFNPPVKRKLLTATQLRDLPYTAMIEQVKKQEREFNQGTRLSGRAIDLINRLSGGEQIFWFKNSRGCHYRDRAGERIAPDLIHQLLFRHILRFEK